jgi:hypothetical protein
MTEYTDVVEKYRLKQEADAWGQTVKYLHASNGIIETAYNNGDINYQENWEGGRNWTVYAEQPTNLIDKFLRWRADYGK